MLKFNFLGESIIARAASLILLGLTLSTSIIGSIKVLGSLSKKKPDVQEAKIISPTEIPTLPPASGPTSPPPTAIPQTFTPLETSQIIDLQPSPTLRPTRVRPPESEEDDD